MSNEENGGNVSQLEDLKTVLNSLVIPYPNGLSLRQLCNEYQELEGMSHTTQSSLNQMS